MQDQHFTVIHLTNAKFINIIFGQSGYGEVWYRAWFGSKRPRVRIPILRPKIWNPHLRVPDFLLGYWDSKDRPEQSEGKQQSGGQLLRSRENPLLHRRTPYGCGYGVILYNLETAPIHSDMERNNEQPEQKQYL